ncbi:MAG: DprA winged helix domain, partial [Actinomycetota bacterium]
GLDTRRHGRWCDTRVRPTTQEHVILDALGNTPKSVDEIALTTTLSVIDVAVLLGRLEEKNWVAHTDGWWEALIN